MSSHVHSNMPSENGSVPWSWRSAQDGGTCCVAVVVVELALRAVGLAGGSACIELNRLHD